MSGIDIDDWRGEVAALIREAGHGWLADEVGGLDDEYVRELHAEYGGDPAALSAAIIAAETSR